MNPLLIDTIKFKVDSKDDVKEFALTGKQRKDYDCFRHVVKVKIFAINTQTIACLTTDIMSKNYSDRFKKYKK